MTVNYLANIKKATLQCQIKPIKTRQQECTRCKDSSERERDFKSYETTTVSENKVTRTINIKRTVARTRNRSHRGNSGHDFKTPFFNTA